MSLSLLTLKNLACARGGRRLFDGLNLELGAGECVQVQGPNGSGKSTLLRIAAGLFPDYEGRVEAVRRFYLGHKSAVNALLSPLENLQWYEHISSVGSVAAGGQRSGRPGTGYPKVDADAAGGESRPTVLEAMQRLGLRTCANTPCGQLSQGQQRRVGLARALICTEALWLLDEPLTALDSEGRTLVGDLMAEHCAAGGAVLCATHQSLAIASARAITLGRAA